MPKRALIAVALIASSVLVSAQQKPAASNLRIVVIAGEGAVNIIQQKTAVAPIVEIRDRNNLPVAGATVTFSVGGSGATFGTGSTLTVVTNAAGQATAAGFTPTVAGAVQVNVSAAFQGQLASAAITQTNFATATQAAAAAGSSGGGGAAGGTAGAAGGGGGIGATTLVIAGAAVAGGAVAATQTEIFSKKGANITLRGRVFARVVIGSGECGGVRGEGAISNSCFLDALSGAVVTTTLDSTTATTAADGNFELTTTVAESGNECIAWTIMISASGQPSYAANTRGFATSNSSSRVMFAISPPTPASLGTSGC